jgi:hypothetical protein
MIEQHFWLIWFLIGVFIVANTTFLAGFCIDMPKMRKQEMVVVSIIIGLMWPGAILMVLIMAPIYVIFFGLYKLGEWLGYKLRT